MKTRSRLILSTFAALCCSAASMAESPGVKFLYSKDAESIALNDWKAKWIWVPGVKHTEKNHRALARKTFSLDGLPLKAQLAITADSHYELWINGEFVARGPARCNAHHQNYDLIDVRPLLKIGENTLAVRVHYHGIMKSYYGDAYPGLLVQLDLEEQDGTRSIVSDKSWKVLKDPSWDSSTEVVSTVNANNFPSSVNLGRGRRNWQRQDYSDANWPDAVYQTGQPTWPPRPAGYEPYALQKPWLSLVPRDLPPLIEYERLADKVLKVSEAPQYSKVGFWGDGDARKNDALHNSMQDVQKPLNHCKVSGIEDFVAGKGPLHMINAYPDPQTKLQRLPAFDTTVVFDFGEVIDGYPLMEAQGAQGTIVDVNYAPYLIDGEFIPGALVGNFSDRITLSGKADRWENSEPRTFRYMAITVRGPEPLRIGKLGLRVSEYPFRESGHIEVDGEAFAQNFWEAGDRTLRLITTDAFSDNYQERRQYVQTAYYASRGAYAAFGDTWLQRRLLVQHAQDQLPDGIMPMWAPWNVYEGNKQTPGIFEANHFWLMGLRDYYLFSGDRKTTEQLMVSAERLAESIYRYQRNGKLLFKLPHSYWIDWAKLAQGEENFIINALQLLAFRDYAELLQWMGDEELSAKWSARAEVLRVELKGLWDADKGLFAENRNGGKLDQYFSEHANALAIVAGVAEGAQIDRIVDQILANDEQRVMEPVNLFHYWVVEAIASQGRVGEAMELLKHRYQHMLDDEEINTLWEYSNIHVKDKGARTALADNIWIGRSWSTAQAENAFPASSLSRWVLGLEPTAPGMGEIALSGLSSPYESFKGNLPTPNGQIEVDKNGQALDLTLPAGTRAVIDLAEQKRLPGKTIRVDGRDVPLGKGSIHIESGIHRLELIK